MKHHSNLKLVSSQPDEAVVARHLTEAAQAWATFCAFPYLPQSWFAWLGACDRLEADRLRALRGQRK